MKITTVIERRGIEPVPLDERRGNARGLFSVWFAANVGILSVVFGAVLASLGLDFGQAVAVTAAATTASFLLVGAVSVAGQQSGMPALALSRRAMGRAGNGVAASVSWVSVLGWEVVASVVGAWALVGAAHVLLGVAPGPAADTVALGIMVGASLVLGLLGHAAIVRFQRLAALGFGALTLALVPVMLMHVDWARTLSGHPASLRTMLMAAGIIAAGTGVSWVNLAPDYSRYLPRSERPRAVVGWVTAGAALPTMVLVLTGYLLSTRVHGLASALDPIGPVGAVLPAWLATPYLLTAAGGMLAETNLACYSSGLTLLALGVRIRRTRTVLVDAAVVCSAGLWLMLSRSGFLGPFESFLELLAAGLAAWAGVVLADLGRARRAARAADSGSPGGDIRTASAAGGTPTGSPVGGTPTGFPGGGTRTASAVVGTGRAVDGIGLAAFTVGAALALATTTSPLFTGPWAHGLVGDGSFGFVLGLGTSIAVAWTGWGAVDRRAARHVGDPTAVPDHPETDPPSRLQAEDSGSTRVAASLAPRSPAPAHPPVAATLMPRQPASGSAPIAAGTAAAAARWAPPQRLVLVGSILVDVLVYVDALPERGSDVLAGDRMLSSGGGFNVLTAAARLGLPGAYAGRIGTGAFGRQVARDLETAGIQALVPPAAGDDTGFTVGIVEASGERTFLTAPGVESRLDETTLGAVGLRAGDGVHVSGYDLMYPVSGPAIARWLHGLAPRHLLALDPGPLGTVSDDAISGLLHRVDVFTLNEREALLRSGCDRADEAAVALGALIAPGGVAIVRVGPSGCWVAQPGAAPVLVPGHRADTVDTTGAGDVHTGALLARLAAGDSPLQAARIANVAAALSTERAGGAAGPTAAAVDEALARAEGAPAVVP